MSSHNGTTQDHHVLDSKLDALEATIHRLVDRLEGKKADTPARHYARSAFESLKAHPLAAATIAFAVGYVVFRALRK